MNSREMLSLDTIGMIGMEEQQQNIMKEQQRQNLIRQQTIADGTTFIHNSARYHDISSSGSGHGSQNTFNTAGSNEVLQTLDQFNYIFDEDEENRRIRREKVQQYLTEHLSEVSPQSEQSVISNIMTSSPIKKPPNLAPSVSPYMYIPIYEKDEEDKTTLIKESKTLREQIQQAGSSSSSAQPTPFGINPVKLPRARSETRKGTNRETDEPEGTPRAKARAKSRAPKPEPLTDKIKRGPGRPPKKNI